MNLFETHLDEDDDLEPPHRCGRCAHFVSADIADDPSGKYVGIGICNACAPSSECVILATDDPDSLGYDFNCWEM